MSTDLLTLLGWALAILATVLVFCFGTNQQVRIYENRLRQVLTRRGMTIESLHSRNTGFFDPMDVIEFEAIFITPRGRRIQGDFLVGDRWSRLLFGTVRFHRRSNRPAQFRKAPKTLFEITKEPRTKLEKWFG